MPRILNVRTANGELDEEVLRQAAALLRDGGLVAFPTETVYGLGAHALDPAAVRRVFEAKGRPSFNPLIVHVARPEQARTLASRWPEHAARLADRLWPGPLTLVLPRTALVPDEVTGGLDTVALRAPAHPVARALILEAGLPVAAPSANRFMGVSPTTAQHVAASLGDRVDLILDDGPTPLGIESTVVDCTGPQLRLLRPGGLATSAIEALVGPLLRVEGAVDHGPRASPGMHSKHYSPEAAAVLVDEDSLAAAFEVLPPHARVGGIVRRAARPADPRVVAWELLGPTPDAFARELYAALHRMDAAGVTHVLLSAPPAESPWDAVTDRLLRATGRG